ncbi:putative serine/arginine repetitive matrix protein 5 isoform X2 [Iris pallida]|uniref:Serine/arginine repetitive matrix protein 5 isoform X2 n=1 Tax=Iris pallida TaxID=29817 RepID=A0AAX6GAM5_IRIPA|nr:putative serine/arginine repetitive matrix protein 5 isoform X2 [Iris pallida]
MLLYSPQPVTWTRCISILCTCHVWYFRIIVSFIYITFLVLYMFLYFTFMYYIFCIHFPVLFPCTFMFIPVYLFMYPCTHFISCSCFIT